MSLRSSGAPVTVIVAFGMSSLSAASTTRTAASPSRSIDSLPFTRAMTCTWVGSKMKLRSALRISRGASGSSGSGLS